MTPERARELGYEARNILCKDQVRRWKLMRVGHAADRRNSGFTTKAEALAWLGSYLQSGFAVCDLSKEREKHDGYKNW